jgi:hypothetical protein
VKQARSLTVYLIALLSAVPVSAVARATPRSMAHSSGHDAASALDASPQKQKVMCFWLSYGRQRYICGQETIDEVKKKCNSIASAEVGEPVECSCTDDQEYIRDSCD